MITNEERLKILEMISEGKISAEEGAKLIAALEEPPQKNDVVSTRKKTGGPRWLRIRVTDIKTGKSKATVNLPIGLVDAGFNIASKFTPDVDFDSLSGFIKEGAQGKIIDVTDDEDGEHVEIYLE